MLPIKNIIDNNFSLFRSDEFILQILLMHKHKTIRQKTPNDGQISIEIRFVGYEQTLAKRLINAQNIDRNHALLGDR